MFKQWPGNTHKTTVPSQSPRLWASVIGETGRRALINPETTGFRCSDCVKLLKSSREEAKFRSLHEETSRNLLGFYLILKLITKLHPYIVIDDSSGNSVESVHHCGMHLLVYAFDIFWSCKTSYDLFCIKIKAHHKPGLRGNTESHLRFERITWIMPLLRLKASIETLNVHLDAQHLWMISISGLHCILRVMFPLF